MATKPKAEKTQALPEETVQTAELATPEEVANTNSEATIATIDEVAPVTATAKAVVKAVVKAAKAEPRPVDPLAPVVNDPAAATSIKDFVR